MVQVPEERKGAVQTLLYSATMPHWVTAIARQYLKPGYIVRCPLLTLTLTVTLSALCSDCGPRERVQEPDESGRGQGEAPRHAHYLAGIYPPLCLASLPLYSLVP